MITIYTTGPECRKCWLTKQRLEKAGVECADVLLEDVPDKAAEFRAAGHLMAPVVVDELTGAMWSDFRVDEIKAAIKARQAA
ncbi:NrdH-like glutaredoxin [Mycobacterium phage LilPharaoh]|uniref:NrdH-like glutaredoxin n=1 Tax=Mycobacterium phage Amelie TaxID=1913035 RepID=A0A1J0GQ11_9CAUD|nr:NrdH-like glutaredoxin [Mycobacterium phage Enkosi]YP_009952573.1 NrdH-like glutaredoxin [Mycobacterium phage Amelie]ATN90509.1 NrdH-like glutaredoxin [Mycobacterium phage LilPharaoh]AVP42633.1 NrdH-like glutaredoxin [Mycobacterium phage SgtBeansprout]AXC37161.1 NrdH-like glutaredoxin [Mycobacterium phage Biglebops]QGJ93340.1 NrdH-like glutaredoxin [Mycobacterium phage Mdavu]UQS94455.1 NrdH-like glutaredoxin [Mycobacterium phage Nutello]UXE03218.1 NrdH-like glutaredoxin [Mycobacterium pha